ncbi:MULTISPECIES: 1,2-phenylacetyl-CoA epoxidase subunit PaaD [Streptomyces]|uniref:Phenylacetate-CoA oxygenase subunit PaaJ n=1 Tax=Streptomyces griseiscabiei TaxID=2993540 RepID=A0ABU4L1T9_9ACTN|nr:MULTISPECIES: 1,2-phenylacetyl-CoA epoxidase subunit PaaD [Streptomyces]MBZ3906075.1 phenylacetate-CoA oxygenase subunit PaaJ [Streptomyces griseiscabiei]MDX2909709.1 phenylacetate-CoA oxygenase subunit PaaJ [Streptomyces griseiscabiei]
MVSAAVRMDLDQVGARVGAVPDPELPMVTLADLGVLRSVREDADGVVEVVVTPTYLGCPALPVIESDLRTVLADCGHPDGRVTWALSPPWTSDLISEAGRSKLAGHGIAPPGPAAAPLPVRLGLGRPCPHCGSVATRPLGPFGATGCQTVLTCTACHESFPHMKAV